MVTITFPDRAKKNAPWLSYSVAFRVACFAPVSIWYRKLP